MSPLLMCVLSGLLKCDIKMKECLGIKKERKKKKKDRILPDK